MKPNLSSIDSMRSVADQVYPLSLKRISLVDLLRRNGISTNEPQSLHTILDRWDPTRGATVFRLLWQNTFLLQVKAEVEILTPVGYVKKDVTFCEKPDTPARATEFGAMLASSDFDAAFLCEVWTDEVKLLLLVALMGNLQSIAEGPPPEKSTIAVAGLAGAPLIRPAGAGLCTLGIRQVIVDHTYHVFSVQGELPRDSDALAKKAVLLSRVAIGSGVLDC